jgi:hypothetical protein
MERCEHLGVVRGGIEPPTFRFSGRTYPKLALVVRELCAVVGGYR